MRSKSDVEIVDSLGLLNASNLYQLQSDWLGIIFNEYKFVYTNYECILSSQFSGESFIQSHSSSRGTSK